jgi:hypothetical protein
MMLGDNTRLGLMRFSELLERGEGLQDWEGSKGGLLV